MKCLETRWDNQNKQSRRRYKCECGVKGFTTEQWIREVVAPSPPKAPPKMRRPKVVNKKQLIAVTKKKEEREFTFDDMAEDYSQDVTGLGIDIPKGDEW